MSVGVRRFGVMDTCTLDELDALTALESAVDGARKVLGGGLWRLPETDILDVLRRIHAVNARLQSLQLTVVREADTRGVPSTLGAVSTPAFLDGALRMSPGLAREHAKLATAFATSFTDTGAALAAGEISYEQAKAIYDTVSGLPSKATADDRHRAEQFLLSHADALNAKDLKGLHKKLDEVIDPDGAGEREDVARKKRAANIRDNHDGTQTLTWTEIDEHMAMVKAAIDALSAPIPSPDGQRDERAASERRADALLELVRRILDAGDLATSRGIRPHLHVTFTEETLRGEPGAPSGRTASGEDLSPATIARLMCDASITGILLNTEGGPLRVGRTHRTVRPWQWIALVARDTGCQFPNCTRPASWCQAHHLTEWVAQNGNTDVDDMALFCQVHHHYLHDKGWTARMHPDGYVELLPPPWVDPLQKPRRNQYWITDREFRDFTTDPDP